MSAVGAVGMAVVGRLGTLTEESTTGLDAGVEQGAAGLGNTLFFAIAVLGMGVVLGFDPLISQAVGAREHARARQLTWQAAWMALFAAVALALVVVAVAFSLKYSPLDPASARSTARYLLARAPSLLPFLVAGAGRAYVQALGRTRPLIVAAILANLVNVPLCVVLVLGDRGLEAIGLGAIGLGAMGLEPMGATGAALAATGSVTVMAAAILYAATRIGAEAGGSTRWTPADGPSLRRGLALGAPLSMQLGAEVGAFALVSFLAGTLGANTLAAHHVALTLASIPFQISLAISSAAAVRVGLTVGEGVDPLAPRRAGATAIGVGLLFSGAAALAFALGSRPFASLITGDPDVLRAASALVLIAAGFQLVDGVQAIAAGALRGVGDTRATMLANLAGHYLLGIPLGVTLCFHFELGARGLWWGLSAGLVAVSVLLLHRFHRRTLEVIERV